MSNLKPYSLFGGIVLAGLVGIHVLSPGYRAAADETPAPPATRVVPTVVVAPRAEDAKASTAGRSNKSDKGDKAGSAQSALGIGDSLKITFFEMMDVPDTEEVAGKAAQPATVQTFYQRMDLSGDYVVQPDGTITIARLGEFEAIGRRPKDVASDIEAAFTAAMGRQSNVLITVLSREPVYVVGPVKTSGAFPFVSGMIVLQAIALAGGIDHGTASTSQLSELLRETQNGENTADQLRRLLAHRDRLMAEHDGISPVVASKELIDLVGQSEADSLIAGEQQARVQEEDTLKDSSTASKSMVDSLTAEIKIQNDRLENTKQLAEARRARLSKMQKLGSLGLANGDTVLTTQGELAEAEGRVQEVLASISELQVRLNDATRTAARQPIDRHSAVEREITTVTDEITAAQRGRTHSLSLTRLMQGALGDEALKQGSQTLMEIVRHGRKGIEVLPADETTELVPGDVVRIRLVSPLVAEKEQH